jgi:hypothetical protein
MAQLTTHDENNPTAAAAADEDAAGSGAEASASDPPQKPSDQQVVPVEPACDSDAEQTREGGGGSDVIPGKPVERKLSALRDNIATKGQYSYYYGHTLDTPAVRAEREAALRIQVGRRPAAIRAHTYALWLWMCARARPFRVPLFAWDTGVRPCAVACSHDQIRSHRTALTKTETGSSGRRGRGGAAHQGGGGAAEEAHIPVQLERRKEPRYNLHSIRRI